VLGSVAAVPGGTVSQAEAASGLGAGGDFCEGGSLSESPSAARKVLSSEIRFASSRLPQGRVRLPRGRRPFGESRWAAEDGAGPKAVASLGAGTGWAAVLGTLRVGRGWW